MATFPNIKAALRAVLDTHTELVRARTEQERLYPARNTSHLYPLAADQLADAEKAFAAALDVFETACETHSLPDLVKELTVPDSPDTIS